MPALKKIARSDLYAGLVKEAQSVGEKMDCAVKALAITTGLPYATCHEALSAEGRREARRTPDTIWMAALDRLGFTVRRWTSSEMVAMIHSYPKKGIANITTHHPRRFPKSWAPHRGPLLLRSRGHISAYRDGIVHDWAVNSSKQVWAIYEVTKK